MLHIETDLNKTLTTKTFVCVTYLDLKLKG